MSGILTMAKQRVTYRSKSTQEFAQKLKADMKHGALSSAGGVPKIGVTARASLRGSGIDGEVDEAKNVETFTIFDLLEPRK
jgi:hypothetical protein